MQLLMYLPVWKEALVLAWPVFLNHIFTTAMRTTDMILMGLFGPAAVTAVGLGDVWERIVLRIGQGLGAGSISLISQESGVKQNNNRNYDEILTQTLISGVLAGIPFVLLGWLIPETLIGLLGAAPEIIVQASRYLLIVFSAAPFRIISIISSRALQGTGDTKTPMIIGIISNAINIVFSIILALGIGPFPRLSITGAGLGTFIARLFAASAYTIIFLLPGGKLKLRLPSQGWNFTITKQLIKVSIPRILQGSYQSLIAFPFNSLILLFGTEAAAAYHISMRIQQQLMAPLLRSYATVTTILSGRTLGEGRYQKTRRVTKGMLWLTAITMGLVAGVLFIRAPLLIKIFSSDLETLAHGIKFVRTLSIGTFILAFYRVLSGLLTGAGDTRTPFYALVFSQTLFKLGLSYLLAVQAGLGLYGIFIGLVSNYLFEAGWVARHFFSSRWVDGARKMIEERHGNLISKAQK